MRESATVANSNTYLLITKICSYVSCMERNYIVCKGHRSQWRYLSHQSRDVPTQGNGQYTLTPHIRQH